MLLFIKLSDTRLEQYLSFQYITCYSLSGIQKHTANNKGGFNTSHVTLYHELLLELDKRKNSFNTSHVTLYQKTQTKDCHMI